MLFCKKLLNYTLIFSLVFWCINCQNKKKRLLLLPALALASSASTNPNSGNSNPNNNSNNGSSNTQEKVTTPTFDPSSGTYSSTPINLTMSTTTAGANIYFTLDGSNPTSSSYLYIGPIHIWLLTGKTIKAIAKKAGMLDSDVATFSGIFSYPPLKTGQTSCWNAMGTSVSCTGTGQDGDLKKGASRSYTDSGDGTIIDNGTGLVWQKCSRGQNNDSTCSGTATNANWADANSYCTNLNLAGKVWRLPTIQELLSLIDWGKSSAPMIAGNFPNTANDFYWSSSDIDTYSRGLRFDDGSIGANSKTGSSKVRCVSGVPKGYTENFTDNGDGTIIDNGTGLVWQKCSRGQNNDSTCSGTKAPVNWLNALSYCNSLNLAGKTWRLPNINELYTIIDTTKTTAPTIATTIFPNTPNEGFWTSTTLAQLTTEAFLVSFNDSYVAYDSKSVNQNVRCVSDKN